jgi:hypothetical protein
VNVETLLISVEAVGFKVELTDNGPRLVQVEPGSRVPSDLLTALKQNRAAIIAYLKFGPRESQAPEEDTPGTSAGCAGRM